MSTNLPAEFSPPRRRGVAFFLGVSLLMLGASGFLLLLAFEQQSSGFFVLALLGALLIFLPVPFVLYAAFSLLRANYIIDRDGLRLRWGLRSEDIPLPEVEWVRPASEVASSITYPGGGFTGILRGIRPSADLGPVEFMASEKERLLLVATRSRVYAISPAHQNEFLRAFQTAFELGSIAPLTPQSTQAGSFLKTILADRRAFWLILSGILLTISLLVVVALIIPTRATINLGYQPTGMAVEPSPSDRLLLLPVLSFFMLAVDLTFGFFLYRRMNLRAIAYIVFASSLFVPLLLFIALLFIF